MQMPTARTFYFLSGLALGVVAVVGALTLKSAHRYHGHIHPTLPPAMQAHDFELPFFDPIHDEIIEGTPNYRGRALAYSHDGKAHSGVFECDGPSKFNWRYEDDETIYVIEGKVHIEHAGGAFTLEPGDSAFFPAGVTATWTVPERIKKTFFTHQVGHVARLMRKLDPWEITVSQNDRSDGVKAD